jgi:phage tail sheath gpL-like
LSPSTVVGGASVSGTVTLSGPAPSAGIVVMLTSSRPSQAAVPRSVTVAAGQRSATFSVTTVPVTADTTAWISGTYRGATKGATLAIKR